jgi:hypothetical protein
MADKFIFSRTDLCKFTFISVRRENFVGGGGGGGAALGCTLPEGEGVAAGFATATGATSGLAGSDCPKRNNLPVLGGASVDVCENVPFPLFIILSLRDSALHYLTIF